MNNFDGSNEPQRSYYRLRPMRGNTLDELRNHYLWFSKRQGFKDKCDANIGAFITDTPQIFNGLHRFLNEDEIKSFINKMDDIGICCFTKKLPNKDERKNFPNGENSICIEYDKNKLEKFFREDSGYTMAHPFKDVEYFNNPTRVEGDGPYHILVEKRGKDYLYEPVSRMVLDAKEFDRLIVLLLTRIKWKYHKQHETRMIIGGKNLEYFDTSRAGYYVEIPNDAISKVYFYSDDNKIFLQQLKEIPYIADKIEMI